MATSSSRSPEGRVCWHPVINTSPSPISRWCQSSSERTVPATVDEWASTSSLHCPDGERANGSSSIPTIPNSTDWCGEKRAGVFQICLTPRHSFSNFQTAIRASENSPGSWELWDFPTSDAGAAGFSDAESGWVYLFVVGVLWTCVVPGDGALLLEPRGFLDSRGRAREFGAGSSQPVSHATQGTSNSHQGAAQHDTQGTLL